MNAVNRLWVHVSCFSEGNLFAVYPRLLQEMMANAREASKGPPDFEMLLPSDREWKTKLYFQLVEKQRETEGMSQPAAFLDRPRSAGPWDTTQPPAKRSRRCMISSASSASRDTVRSSVSPVTWTVSDISKAAGLLTNPPLPVDFDDEQEMRRVYSLIYDVFRYKNILNEALSSVSFFYLFPEMQPCKHLVLLLLYDLYHRRFVEREHADGSAAAAEKLFPKCGLSVPEAALWATRIRLAASMSRLRIANSALRLSDMLPSHLRDEKVIKALQNAPVTCWVNKNRISNKNPEMIFDEIKMNFDLQDLSDDSSSLGSEDFRWDPLCPLFLSFHNSRRKEIAQSHFVHDNILVIQNRSFCFGPAIFCKLLFQHNLTGTVVQSHISSPRSTAYLATLLSENDQIQSLIAFGAGRRKAEYEEYFKELNIKNIIVYEKRFIDMQPDSDVLEQVAAVFVTPPNSYSAVNDPIDLVCSRGGDLSMLEILTDTDDTAEGHKRVGAILEDQRLTLRFSMSRPQIQFVLYETHSQLTAENEDMAKQVLNEVNRAAQYKHAELLGKIHHHPVSAAKTESAATVETVSSEIEINNNESEVKKETGLQKEDETNKNMEQKESNITVESDESYEDMYKEIEVPPTDIFEEHQLPDLCYNSDQCANFSAEGCYLALLERKEVTRFNAKYMIKMAETRGLFGGNSDSVQKSKAVKTAKPRKKETSATTPTPIKRKHGTFEVERIAAQTHASMMRSCTHVHRDKNGEVIVGTCTRYHMEESVPKVPPARQWWAETTRYLTRLRRSLIRQKLVSHKPSILRALQHEKILKDISNIDEILSRFERKHGPNIPAFPRLRLSRSPIRVERDTFPVYINSIEIQQN